MLIRNVRPLGKLGLLGNVTGEQLEALGPPGTVVSPGVEALQSTVALPCWLKWRAAMKRHVHDILVARFGGDNRPAAGSEAAPGAAPTPYEGATIRATYRDEDWELSDGSGTCSARYSGTFDEERSAAVFHFVIMRQELDALLSW